jgi:hypothetical protein
MARVSRIYVSSHFDGGEMGFFLVLFWCSAIVGDAKARNILAIIPGSASVIPDWTSANSRLALLREFAGKCLICLTILAARQQLRGENRRIPGFDGKNRESCPTDGTGRSAASRQRRRSLLLGADRPVACQPRHDRGAVEVQHFAGDGLPA